MQKHMMCERGLDDSGLSLDHRSVWFFPKSKFPRPLKADCTILSLFRYPPTILSINPLFPGGSLLRGNILLVLFDTATLLCCDVFLIYAYHIHRCVWTCLTDDILEYAVLIIIPSRTRKYVLLSNAIPHQLAKMGWSIKLWEFDGSPEGTYY